MWEIPMLGVLSIAACNHSKASSYSFEMADTTRDQRIRKKIPRCRILIMGRANAGKSTILQRVCKTMEAPEVIDRNGNKVGPHLYPDHGTVLISVQISLSIIEGTREVRFTELDQSYAYSLC